MRAESLDSTLLFLLDADLTLLKAIHFFLQSSWYLPSAECKSVIAPLTRNETFSPHSSFLCSQVSNITFLNERFPLPLSEVRQINALRQRFGFCLSGTRLHSSPQNIQCNLKSNNCNEHRVFFSCLSVPCSAVMLRFKCLSICALHVYDLRHDGCEKKSF